MSIGTVSLVILVPIHMPYSKLTGVTSTELAAAKNPVKNLVKLFIQNQSIVV